MKPVRIDDSYLDEAEVSVKLQTSRGNFVSLDFDPDGYSDGQSLMYYTPEQARKLAAALTLAAEEAEKQ